MENRDLRRAAGNEQLRWPAPKRAAFEARAPGVAQARKPATRGFRGLTFEVRRDRRQDARPGLAKMYRVPPDRAWWPAVGAPVERGVRPHLEHDEHATYLGNETNADADDEKNRTNDLSAEGYATVCEFVVSNVEVVDDDCEQIQGCCSHCAASQRAAA